jgi:hypothetical protein
LLLTTARAAHATACAAGAGLYGLAIIGRKCSSRNSNSSGSNRHPSSTTRPETGLHAGVDALDRAMRLLFAAAGSSIRVMLHVKQLSLTARFDSFLPWQRRVATIQPTAVAAVACALSTCGVCRQCWQCNEVSPLLCCMCCCCSGSAEGGSCSSLEGQPCDHPSPASLLIHQLLHIRAHTKTAAADAARHDGLCARLDGRRNSRTGGMLGGESAHSQHRIG